MLNKCSLLDRFACMLCLTTHCLVVHDICMYPVAHTLAFMSDWIASDFVILYNNVYFTSGGLFLYMILYVSTLQIKYLT